MPAINALVDLTLEDGVALITLDNPPVNALSPRLMDGMYDAFVQAIEDPAARGILLICAGRTFIAGADIKALGVESPKVDFFELQAKIEDSAKPVMAALHGTCLGGGLEVALTCHYRIAAPGTRLGLPEVNLGLLPGGGGTQRLPRIVGVAAGLDLLMSGAQVDALRSLEVGLIDAIAQGQDLTADAKAYMHRLLAEGRPAKRVRDLTDKIACTEPSAFDDARTWAERRRRGEEAPRAIIRCVEAAVRGDFEAGIAVERAEFQTLLDGPQSAALRYAFFAERQASKIAGLAPEVQPRPIVRIGVAGAGTMGCGISMALLDAGIATVLFDTAGDSLARAGTLIASHYDAAAAQGRLSAAEAAKRRSGLILSDAMEGFADCDLVIEAVVEELDVKQAVLAEIERIAPSALLATNTSFLDLDAIAAAAACPANVIGLHFFSPANVMRLLEIVRGKATSDEAVATAFALARKLGKVGVLSGVCAGFIGNRMMLARQKFADAMILQGIAPEVVDRAATQFGLAMGPFAMWDLAGLDLGWRADWSTGRTVIERLCEEGRRGRKTGAGYYDYDAAGKPMPSALTAGLIAECGAAAGIAPRSLSDAEILDRLLIPMINEGARILEEGIAQRASDIDMVWVHGYGWPAYRGGPMYHADIIGLPAVIDAARSIGLEPASLLVEYAAAGRKLTG